MKTAITNNLPATNEPASSGTGDLTAPTSLINLAFTTGLALLVAPLFKDRHTAFDLSPKPPVPLTSSFAWPSLPETPIMVSPHKTSSSTGKAEDPFQRATLPAHAPIDSKK